MGVIADKLRGLQKTYKENNYAEYDQILHFAIEIAENVTHTPYGFPVYATECGKMRLNYSKGYDIYCNACGRKIKIVDDKEVGEKQC